MSKLLAQFVSAGVIVTEFPSGHKPDDADVLVTMVKPVTKHILDENGKPSGKPKVQGDKHITRAIRNREGWKVETLTDGRVRITVQEFAQGRKTKPTLNGEAAAAKLAAL